jgi:hypothetical protein
MYDFAYTLIADMLVQVSIESFLPPSPLQTLTTGFKRLWSLSTNHSLAIETDEHQTAIQYFFDNGKKAPKNINNKA